MSVQNKITQAIEITCDGCTKTIHQIRDVDADSETSNTWMAMVEDEGWLHINATLYSVPEVDGDWPSATLIACSIPCAQQSMGTFLSKHAQPVSATPTAHDPLASL